MKENLLTKGQREALDRLLEAGGVALMNDKRDGFDGIRARDVVQLMIARAAVIEADELRLTQLGRLVAGVNEQTAVKLFDYLVDHGQEYP